MTLFSVNNVILLTCYLFNFIQYDNTSLISYNLYFCKACCFLLRLLTAFNNSWLFLLLTYVVANLFEINGKGAAPGESQAPLIIKSPDSTRLNHHIKRLILVFIFLCLVYSFDLVVIDQIEYTVIRGNVSKTFRRCGIPDSQNQHLLILVSYLIDLVAFFLAPFIIGVIKTSLAMKRAVEDQRNRSIQLAPRPSSVDQNDITKIQTSHSSRTSDTFYLRTKQMVAARTTLFILSTLPIFVCPMFYIYYLFWSERSFGALGNTLINMDLAFAVFCLNNMLTIAVMLFFFSLYTNKVFRRVMADFVCVQRWSCCVTK